MKDTTREQCAPAEADWFVNVDIGKTFCPMADDEHACPHRDADTDAHDRQYGTDTSYEYGYFKGDRPDEDDVASLLPEGWYEIEHTIKRCPKDYDESECRYCEQPIQFDVAASPHWGSRQSGPICRVAEDREHEPIDEFNE